MFKVVQYFLKFGLQSEISPLKSQSFSGAGNLLSLLAFLRHRFSISCKKSSNMPFNQGYF